MKIILSTWSQLKEETFKQGCPTKSDRQELGGDVEESEMQGVEP